MTWTPEHRRRYAPAINDMVRASALARLAAVIDAIAPPARTGRPRLWSSLIMLQALWWLCRAGSSWCMLPAVYPPRQTVGSRLDRLANLWFARLRRWMIDGVDHGCGGECSTAPWSCSMAACALLVAASAGPAPAFSTRRASRPMIRAADHQRGPRGYDAGKKVKGRKRVLLVDTEGLVHAIQLVPALVQDRDTPAVIEPELAGSSLLKVWADLAFNGDAAVAPRVRCGIDLELVGRKNKVGFEVEPRRWRVEPTFGVLGRYRRLLVDHEGSTTMSRIMTLLAALFITGNRFQRQIMA